MNPPGSLITGSISAPLFRLTKDWVTGTYAVVLLWTTVCIRLSFSGRSPQREHLANVPVRMTLLHIPHLKLHLLGSWANESSLIHVLLWLRHSGIPSDSMFPQR